MLRLEAVTAGYQKVPVICRVDYEFEPGKVTAIIGPNGSGKSTLLKAIAGLCDLYSGKIYLNNMLKEEVGHREFARQVSYLPQSHTGGAITVQRMVLHGRFPHLTYPRRYSSRDYECCREAMERIGILSLKDRRVEELSGGQRQKVYLAMALAGEMEVSLLDEPTTYLDVRYQLEILETMKQMRNLGKTVVAVLHDLNLAMQTADRVLIMDGGRKVFAGLSEEAMENGIIDRVFQVNSKILRDDQGKKHLLFERKQKL